MQAGRRPLLISAYRGLSRALTPLFHLLFWWRCRSGKEIAQRKGERFGRPQQARPSGHLIWVHAASVGETMSVLPLIEALCASGNKVLLTTVTVTAAEIAATRLPQGAFHQFVPYDAPVPLTRFLDHWSPDLAMVVESEIWPCQFDELRSRNVPFILLNGRLSDTSHRNWSRLPAASRYVFECLDLVLAQSAADAGRFRRLGCKRVETPGNLKFDASVPEAAETEIMDLRSQIDGRPVWLAALTHPGEDAIALRAFEKLLKEFPDLLLILVPRHPARADDIAELIGGYGLTCTRRSTGEKITPSTRIYLGDTLGEMGLFYRLAPVTFLGGSFTDVGGHNPVEAALGGSALVTGPHVANARAVYKEFWAGKAALRASQPEDLTDLVAGLLRRPEDARDQASRARALVEAGRGVQEKILLLLRPYLKDRADGREPEAERGQSS
ncbi:3-deoxy-D-manno-octulosonic acid transferase [Roseibium marinum]|uniref:3-deoxy-D-manno-octulosonic acid transferase n=1 Tax=Roseibium marinum TaxID=281252 RepID=A0A2S3V443_9HYPH|nr:3-deoxy-D-manno-octulosonic acid transferase [Roseibium marinum]POF34706.1 3-deoxy-D-manno-octulosonic-acid transferase [Roseibium marinum]